MPGPGRIGQWVQWAQRAREAAAASSAAPPSDGGGAVTAEQLRRAIREGELVVHYQPVVATEDGQIAGLEALVRWEQPERGLRHPGAFMALLRDPDVARPLGEFVLRAACGFVRDLQPDAPGVWLTVNVTRSELIDGALQATIQRILDETGLDPVLLELEVDEEGILGEEERVTGALEALRALGVRVGLDGVGSDDASVEHVQRLPIDAVKVDMRIAARADAIRDSLVAAVEAARTRGLPVTAKRAQHPKRMAEDPDEQRLFDDVRPDFVQSYAYGEPGPPVAIWKALAAVAATPPPRPPRPSPVAQGAPVEEPTEAPKVESAVEPPSSAPTFAMLPSTADPEPSPEPASVAPPLAPAPDAPMLDARPAPPRQVTLARPLLRVTSAMIRVEPAPDADTAEMLAADIRRRPEVDAVSVLSRDEAGCWLWVTASTSAALLAVVEEMALLQVERDVEAERDTDAEAA
ncbi:MAG: EAL domain-containing protein [Dehalococcoidia bacterium]|nr:EAL domain-containing protein [Dehalococcoidia bacterium]